MYLSMICAVLAIIQMELVECDHEFAILIKSKVLISKIAIFQSHSVMNTVLLSLAIFEECGILFSIFITCELCQRISNEFDEINDMIGQFHWYCFPIEINRMLPMILMSTQQTVVFECFGSITCNRETFKKVSLLIQNFNVVFKLLN